MLALALLLAQLALNPSDLMCKPIFKVPNQLLCKTPDGERIVIIVGCADDVFPECKPAVRMVWGGGDGVLVQYPS